VDSRQRRTLAIASTLISFFGFTGAMLSIWSGNLPWFGGAVTFAGFGVVLYVLTALSILPKTVPAEALAKANASIEIPRAISSFAVPLMVGFVVSDIAAGWIFLAAALGALGAFWIALGLPRFEVRGRRQAGIVSRVLQGGALVAKHDLLLPISLCSLFWNFAFAALLVVMVPLITDVYRVDPGTFGIALSAFGLAAVAGSWAAGRSGRFVSPNLILLFGPGSSVLAALSLFFVRESAPVLSIYAAFFLLGFGPSMWMIVQNSVRQIVTPAALLGRVNAVIQTAIYGIRPLGALVGGIVVGATSPRAGLILVTAAYALSFLAAACSRLRGVTSYAELRTAAAA
jgi:predicted MFS family arabinose efflux permease